MNALLHAMVHFDRPELRCDLEAFASRTFFNAYFARANGLSKEALLIQHDIEAVGFNVSKELSTIVRYIIKSAVSSVDKQLPYLRAHDTFMSRFNRLIDKRLIVLNNDNAVD